MKRKRSGLPSWLHRRQTGGDASSFVGECGMTTNMVARLGLCRELEGHTGCVNCIQWSPGGCHLASGSDDKTVIVWDGMMGKALHRLETPHEGNIFSVVWLPGDDRGLLASGAGDCRICLLDVTSSTVLRAVAGHTGRVKRLAVAGDNPGLIWSGSEDGTVRQWDSREKWSESQVAQNTLVNLNTQVSRGSEVKCISICPGRTELLAVGGNDPYVRVYDRRMLTPKASPTAQDQSGGALAYFVPGHLPGTEAAFHKKLRPLTSTFVTFSQDGSELLVNLGGEQIYLYDKFALFEQKASSPLLVQRTTTNSMSATPSNGIVSCKTPLSPLSAAAEEIKQEANTYFENEKYSRAVELYNLALLKHHHPILLANRAAALMRRAWDGDVYAALRDCLAALVLEPSHRKAHLRLARCLADLGWRNEASAALTAFRSKHPEHRNSSHCIQLEQDLAGRGEGEEKKKGKEEEEKRGRQSRGLPKGLAAYNASHFLKTVDEEELDSDDDEEMEMVSEEEEKWPPQEVALRREARDYSARFLGACNTTTDIKEANFLGSHGQFIMAGSDDGKFFIWDRRSGNIVRVLVGDESIVNCLQGHPNTPLLATSGIDPVVRLWQPAPEDGQANSREVEDKDAAANNNQRRMNADPFETILMNMGVPMHLGGEEQGEGGEGAVQCRPS